MKEQLEKVIIRSDRAGVFYGELVSKSPLGDKYAVKLNNCRRIWYWAGAASLSQLATDGVTRPGECLFTVVVSTMEIMGVIEILPCTPKSIKSIESVPVWKA